MATMTAEPYRTYQPAALHPRRARLDDGRSSAASTGASERLIQAVLENSGYRARILAGGHQGGPAHRGARWRRHRAVLPDQLHDRQPRQLPAQRSRRRIGAEEVAKRYVYLTAGCVRCVPLRSVPPELRARPPQHRARGRSACSSSAQDQLDQKDGAWATGLDFNLPITARLPVGDLLRRPRAGPRVPGSAVRGRVPGQTDAVVRESIDYLFRACSRTGRGKESVERRRLAPDHAVLRPRAARGPPDVLPPSRSTGCA